MLSLISVSDSRLLFELPSTLTSSGHSIAVEMVSYLSWNVLLLLIAMTTPGETDVVSLPKNEGFPSYEYQQDDYFQDFQNEVAKLTDKAEGMILRFQDMLGKIKELRENQDMIESRLLKLQEGNSKVKESIDIVDCGTLEVMEDIMKFEEALENEEIMRTKEDNNLQNLIDSTLRKLDKKELLCEGGEFTWSNNNFKNDGSGVKKVARNRVKFKVRFSDRPVVLETISSINTDHKSVVHLNLSTSTVTESFFQSAYYVWRDTLVGTLKAEWLACPQDGLSAFSPNSTIYKRKQNLHQRRDSLDI